MVDPMVGGVTAVAHTPTAAAQRLARLTAAAAAHTAVSHDARISRDDAWLAESDQGRTIAQIADDSGAATSTVHHGILRATARRDAADA
jgi:post-segregation antitoxin (ccd killing protein)